MEISTRFKAQSAMEYLSTYAWAFILIALAIAALYFFITLPSQVIPSRCSFVYAITCEGVSVGTNSLKTIVNLYLVNGQQYDLIGNTIATAVISKSGTANAICSPANVLQSGVIICSITMPSTIPVGQSVVGTLLLNSSVCLQGAASNCQTTQHVSYLGNFTSQVSGAANPIPVSISLSAAPGTISLNTPTNATLTATVDIFGQPARGASIVYSIVSAPASTSNTIAPPAIVTSPGGTAQSILYVTADPNAGAITIEASFGSYSSTNTISIGSGLTNSPCPGSGGILNIPPGGSGYSTGGLCTGYTVNMQPMSTYENYQNACPSNVNMLPNANYYDEVLGCNPTVSTHPGDTCYNTGGVVSCSSI